MKRKHKPESLKEFSNADGLALIAVAKNPFDRLGKRLVRDLEGRAQDVAYALAGDRRASIPAVCTAINIAEYIRKEAKTPG